MSLRSAQAWSLARGRIGDWDSHAWRGGVLPRLGLCEVVSRWKDAIRCRFRLGQFLVLNLQFPQTSSPSKATPSRRGERIDMDERPASVPQKT